MGGSPYDARTIWDLVAARAELTPDRPMLRDAGDRMLTFGEFRSAAEGVAAGLHSVGVAEGTPVTWQVPTTIETIVTSAALARLGALQNPILHIYRSREVTAAVAGTRPRVIIIKPHWRGIDYAAMTESVLSTLDDLSGPGGRPIVLDIDDLPRGNPGELPPPPDGNDDPVRFVYYTSGTTSEPKGVRHTDGTLLAGGRGLAGALQLDEHDVGSIAFPFAHIAGPDYLVTMLLCGFQAVVLESFVPAEAVEILRRHGVTMAGGSTAFYQAYLAEQRKAPASPVIPSLRALSGGGAPKPPEIFHAVLAEMGVRIIHGYGMTEIPMIAMGTPSDTDEQLIATEGAPVAGAEIRIVDAGGSVLAAGLDGEVQVRGDMVCKGYTDPVLTAEAFAEDGWFRTGDLGHLRRRRPSRADGPSEGRHHPEGREHLGTRQMEELVFAHPKVGDVAVVGLPDPDRGERGAQSSSWHRERSTSPWASWRSTSALPASCDRRSRNSWKSSTRCPRNDTLRKVLKYELRARSRPDRGWGTDRVVSVSRSGGPGSRPPRP